MSEKFEWWEKELPTTAKTDQERWEGEARELFTGPEGGSCLGAFVNGYLAACRKRQEEKDKEIERLKVEIRLLKDGLIPKPEYRKLVFRKETKTIWEVNQKGEYLHNTGIRAEETK